MCEVWEVWGQSVCPVSIVSLLFLSVLPSKVTKCRVPLNRRLTETPQTRGGLYGLFPADHHKLVAYDNTNLLTLLKKKPRCTFNFEWHGKLGSDKTANLRGEIGECFILLDSGPAITCIQEHKCRKRSGGGEEVTMVVVMGWGVEDGELVINEFRVSLL